jgi:membrane-bound ClpP family serine protease
LHKALTKEIKLKKRGSKCVVFLTTRGGDPNAGYRIGRCLRHSYPDGVKFCVPSYCKSAGTLIAICADELAIGNQGELGPLDIQVRKPSEFGESNSGLDPINALTVALEHGREAFRNTLVELRRYAKLSTKLAGEFASQIIAFGLWIDITDFEGRRQIDRVTKDQRVLFWKRR